MAAVIQYPPDLPISARREEIVAAIRQNQVVILAGETGSGKTTQLPKMCLEAAGPDIRGKIGCTQPRRVAAMSVSKRVAEELQVTWGREVGCKMRFNDDTGRDTRIKFMTDGILLAEIQGDPMLRAYSMLILDEAHERSLNIDFLLGYLQGLLKKRPDLKLLVTSATIDTEAFSKHFDNAPIIEVSGRLYPVDIRYQPTASFDDQNHIEVAASAVEDALIETHDGDVLVFMPTERDIRETRDLLDGRLGSGFEVLALFGRMASAEQQRIFSPGAKRRVVIATNVAETSITIPRIRYVVDTGLARMSRYNPRTRTKRLPVEPVSQSSANQRAGRAGRVQDGVCIRLYDQEDFDKRPKFTQPEIQRANLAEVILRMKAFKLGDIETFPFINPPVQASITSGYELLHELGALDDTHEMSPLGRELARLPVDPTLGRMLLQARKEDALPELLVIAAGLSIPDPRERPEEAKEQAAAAHKQFWCPDSDFLSLLRLWQAAPDAQGPSGTLNQLRKFCKKNYLSLTRMREWRDVWRQLGDALDHKTPPPDRAQATDTAIHRCILTGHLGHIAMREDRNTYKAAGNRQVTLFPGSNLYQRREKNPKDAALAEKLKQPAWIVAGEIVQTSQLFARSVAKIENTWINELAAHLLQHKYSEPHFQEKTGRVLVWQRNLLHGLEISRQQIDFGKVDPQGATQLFIRHALIQNETPIPHAFHSHNQKLREKIETSLTRIRNNRVYALEDALFDYYEKHFKTTPVSSIHDLNRVITAQSRTNPHFLHATEYDLTHGHDIDCDLALFPDQVGLSNTNTVLPLTYAYKPGQEDDGVTIQVPLHQAHQLSDAQLQWMVPGLREELISVLLRALPKVARRALMPIDPKVAEIARSFEPGSGDFFSSLAQHLTRHYPVTVSASDWPPNSLPAHLQPRIEVLDKQNKTLITDRDLSAIRAKVKTTAIPTGAWEKAVRQFERPALTTWSFGDLPEKVIVEQVGDVTLTGYPGLALINGEVHLRLFRTLALATAATPPAIRKLGETQIGRDLAWLAKELKNLSIGSSPIAKKPASLQDALSNWQAPSKTSSVVAVSNDLPQMAFDHILDHVLQLTPLHPLTEKRFLALCEKARKDLPVITHRTRELFKEIHALKSKIKQSAHRYPEFEADLERLVPADLLRTTPHRQLAHIVRYLRAVQIRAERASINPAKDEDKAWLISDFHDWQNHVSEANRETFRWMLEEYRVQVFAQELGTAQPVSPKRLEALMSASTA
ncbi:ATP-dependent RNA helicase HrpA [Phragmitibacter flavus]|uniref:RNA helicase n=2 Tax=Phragmitibacter flavus TaxID=2576071 RepID=A0A5R8KHF9_9BACT|nr:ATP-dependent RNA helicase HrpA [Phragmitibacter flavus]